MRFIICLILFILIQQEHAQGASQSVQHEKGLISLSLFAGSQENRVLNQDASYSSLSGWHGGLALDIAIFTSGEGQLRLFGSFEFSELKDKMNSATSVQKNELLYGAKAYVSSWLYLGAGYGQSEQKFTSETNSTSTKNSLMAAGLGAEFPISESWSMGLQGWYKMNPIPKQSGIEGNSFSDGYDLSLVFSWSPPSTTIIRYSK